LGGMGSPHPQFPGSPFTTHSPEAKATTNFASLSLLSTHPKP